jgi:hypothetical protein
LELGVAKAAPVAESMPVAYQVLAATSSTENHSPLDTEPVVVRLSVMVSWVAAAAKPVTRFEVPTPKITPWMMSVVLATLTM